MGALIEVILPVFLVLGFGYIAVWNGFFSDAGVDGLMKFTQNFAIPCLLFRAMSTLDLKAGFDLALLFPFYAGALVGFAAGYLGARHIFKRDVEDSVVVGFCGLFSNSLLLGLPITERAYGVDALTANYAIIAVHSPFCFLVGISAMEIARNREGSRAAIPGLIARAVFSQAMIIGILLGLIFNLSGLPQPAIFSDALDLIARTALPTALFGLGGVLVRYRPEGDMRVILYTISICLVLHPAVVWGLGRSTGLEPEAFRSAIITAAMAPGVNAFIFANIYGKAKRVAASVILLGTGLTILTAWIWLALLP